MEFPSYLWWAIGGAVVGAALTAAVLVMTLISARRKVPPPITEEVEEALPSPAVFEVTDLLISPSQARQGEAVTISALVKNTGGSHGNYSIVINLDGRLIATKGVSLDPDSSTPLSLTINEAGTGEHTIEVDHLRGSFLIPPASFKLDNLIVTPDRITEGQQVRVSVRVTNTGGSSGTHVVELKVKGVTETSQEISLAPGASENVTLLMGKKRTGFYPIEVGNLMGKVTVEMSDAF